MWVADRCGEYTVEIKVLEVAGYVGEHIVRDVWTDVRGLIKHREKGIVCGRYVSQLSVK